MLRYSSFGYEKRIGCKCKYYLQYIFHSRALDVMKATSWLLLLFSLPTNRNTERVAVWRRLKKMGAVPLKTSTYLLPDDPAQYEQFQWLAKQIRDYGGDSTLVRAQEIEGLTKEKVVSLFNAARDR